MWKQAPKLVRFVIVNSAVGVAIGWLIAAAFIIFNVGGIGALYMKSDHQIAATAIIMLSSGLTFGFGYLATAVMLLPTDKDDFDRC